MELEVEAHAHAIFDDEPIVIAGAMIAGLGFVIRKIPWEKLGKGGKGHGKIRTVNGQLGLTRSPLPPPITQ